MYQSTIKPARQLADGDPPFQFSLVYLCCRLSTSKVRACVHGSFQSFIPYGDLYSSTAQSLSALQLSSTLLIALRCGNRDRDLPLALHSSSCWYRTAASSITPALKDEEGKRWNRNGLWKRAFHWKQSAEGSLGKTCFCTESIGNDGMSCTVAVSVFPNFVSGKSN